MTTWDDLPRAVRAAFNRKIELVVEREHESIPLSVTPENGKIGLQPTLGGTPLPIPRAIGRGFARSATMVWLGLRWLGAWVSGSDSVGIGWQDEARIERVRILIHLATDLAVSLPLATIADLALFAIVRRRFQRAQRDS